MSKTVNPTDRPVALLLSGVRPDAKGNGIAQRAWMWAVTLAAEHRLTSIVIPAYPEASDGRTPVPGNLVILRPAAPAVKSSMPDLVEAGRIEMAAWRAALPKEIPARIIVFRLYMQPMAELLPGAWWPNLEVDFDDYESRTRRSLALLALRHARLGKALTYAISARRFASIESKAPTRYNRIQISAAEDGACVARRFPSAQITVAANRISVPLHPVPRASRAGKSVLFVGTLSYLPNEDAVLWLANRIWPRLRRLVPDCRIIVAGAAPSSLMKVMHRAGLEYLGPVRDLEEAYGEATVAVAPLRGGGGTKIKVLEAWKHGCPVVATSHAARGLGATDGEHLLIADTSAAFANSCARLLCKPDFGSCLAANAIALLRDHFALPES